MFRWLQAISIPSAVLGVIAFFLPWFEMSCGPVRVTLSGYEMATGRAREKLSGERSDKFWGGAGQQLQGKLSPGQIQARQRQRRPEPPSTPQQPDKKPQETAMPHVSQDSTPALWSIPAACLILLALSIFGLPRAPTILVVALAGAYLAYFGITVEQTMNDPAVTGGLLEHRWLFGFWASWVGLLVPAIFALARPKTAKDLAP